MCQQCQDKIEALQATVATLYEELAHRKGIIADQQTTIGTLQTENTRIRQRLIDSIEHSQKIVDAAKVKETA